jgi:hypothetical protein
MYIHSKFFFKSKNKSVNSEGLESGHCIAHVV